MRKILSSVKVNEKQYKKRTNSKIELELEEKSILKIFGSCGAKSASKWNHTMCNEVAVRCWETKRNAKNKMTRQGWQRPKTYEDQGWQM